MQQSASLPPPPPTTQGDVTDPIYPGTAVVRMNNIRERVKTLSLDGVEWEEARKMILWAGGLRDIQDKRLVGNGYTGHSFNDWNHCDLTAMLPTQTHLENNNQVAGIHTKNSLGQGILAASLEELGPGGSWSTCLMGCNYDPPRDVAHLQFRARIAFKLVWVPPSFTSFVLVDDDGKLLKMGKPTGELPDIRERTNNFKSVGDSKYSTIAKNLMLQEMIQQNQSSSASQKSVTAADVNADGHMKPK